MLDFMRKWYLFGWSFRDLMRLYADRVSDRRPRHVSRQYLGAPVAATPKGRVRTSARIAGATIEPGNLVNTVQRAQTSHLPDPVDPAPVDQNIGVYFTHLCIGGVSFAIMEDRKWKSALKSSARGAYQEWMGAESAI